MEILFKSITIQNFMSIGDMSIDLSDSAYTLIEGTNARVEDNARSNGSGKSSIFEALVWVLTGNTIRGNKDVVNHNGTDGTYVKLDFIVDKHTFEIIRTKEHSKYKTNLLITIDGVDKSGKGIRDSEKLLVEYLPELTSSLIGSVIVLGQGLPQKFTNNSPSGRKEVLEKLFKSDYMIQDLKDRISKRRSELNTELREVQDKRLVNLTRIETLTDKINLDKARYLQLKEMSSVEEECKLLDEEIRNIEATITALKTEIDSYTSKRNIAIEKASACKIQRAEIIADIDKEYESTKEFANDGINTCRVKLNLAKTELDKVKKIKDVCPTCGQKLPEVNKPDLKPYEKAVEDALAELGHWSEQLDKIKAEIDYKKINRTEELGLSIILYNKEAEEILTKVEQLTNEQGTQTQLLMNKRKSYEEKVSVQNTRLFEMESLNTSIENNQVIIDNLVLDNKELDEAENVLNERISIQNRFNTAITRDFRGYLLNDIILYINKRAKQYCADIFNTDLIEFRLDGNNLLIEYNNKKSLKIDGYIPFCLFM